MFNKVLLTNPFFLSLQWFTKNIQAPHFQFTIITLKIIGYTNIKSEKIGSQRKETKIWVRRKLKSKF
jgi:hypothetical protein